jgi:hypothetical protein
MQISVGQLRALFRQGLSEGGKISAHPDYMKKERVREHLQQLVVNAVADGSVKEQQDLEDFVATIVMAASALKMIPLTVYQKLQDEKTT